MPRVLTAMLALWAVAATVVALQRGGPVAAPAPAAQPPAAVCAPCPECSSGGPKTQAAPAAVAPAQAAARPACVCPPLPTALAPTEPREIEAAAACDAGRASWCDMAAMIAQRTSPARATQYLARACNLGAKDDCERLGWALVNGEGTPADRERGLSILRDACDAGHCFYLGLAQRRDDAAEAIRAYTVCCGQRQALCCNDLGEIYRDQKDYELAVGWFEAGCALGNEHACAALVKLAESGKGGAMTPERLLELRKRACAVGDLKSCDRLKQ